MLKNISFLLIVFLSFSCTDRSGSFYFYSLEAPIEAPKKIIKEKEAPLISEPKRDLIYQEEIFNFDIKKPLLDILIVLDVSYSMPHHLKKLGKSLSHLLLVVSDYDWQIAVTLADHGDHSYAKDSDSYEEKWQDHIHEKDPRKSYFGKLMLFEEDKKISDLRILNPSVPNYEEIFYHSLSQNIDSKGKYNCDLPPFCQRYLEQPLRVLKSSMERSAVDNGDFFRKDSNLIAIIISNEDERKGDLRRATRAEEVLATFNKQIKKKGKNRFFAFSFLITDQACLVKSRKDNESEALVIGETISQLAKLTGGENVDICAEDYAPFLAKISHKIRSYVEASIDLKQEPVPETLEISFIGGETVPWELNGRKIIFKKGIQRGTQIQVRYDSFNQGKI